VSDRPNLRDLVGSDVPDAELERLRYADELLRSTDPPPEVPESLTAAVLAIPESRRSRRFRVALGVAAAAVLAAATFAVGVWVGGDEPAEVAEQITLTATARAPREAWMTMNVFPQDPAGNWAILADVGGLPPLPDGAFYEVWMTKHDELASACGRFTVDGNGEASDVWLNAPYEFEEYDRWVVVAVLPGQPPSGWLLDGPVTSPA
jgi:hypothetical protein